MPVNEKTYWGESGKYQKEYDTLHKILVPLSGPCNEVRGEILRAASRIYWRRFNDGDGVLNPSLNSERAYLRTKGIAVYPMSESDYEGWMDGIIEKVLSMPFIANLSDSFDSSQFHADDDQEDEY